MAVTLGLKSEVPTEEQAKKKATEPKKAAP